MRHAPFTWRNRVLLFARLVGVPVGHMTPVQISRNLRTMRERSTDSQPSRTLRNFAMIQLGTRMASVPATDGTRATIAPAIHPER